MNVIAPAGLTITLVGDTEILISRHIKGSPEQTFRAHTEADLIPKWLTGPEDWTMPVCISEARAGGHFRYEWAKGIKGFYATGEFIAVTPFSRLEHIERMFLPDPTPDNHVETTFTAKDGGTLMVMRMSLPDAATRSAMMATGMADGMSLCYDLLETLL